MTLKRADYHDFLRVIEEKAGGPANLLNAFLNFHGELNWGRQQLIVHALQESTNQPIEREEIFGSNGEIKYESLDSIVGFNREAYFSSERFESEESHTVLEAGENEWKDQSLPPPMNMRIGLESRPSYSIDRLQDVTVFVGPYGYQTYCLKRNAYWPYASSRSIGRSVAMHPAFEIRRPVVICQDQFDCGNIAHFLYDAVPRIISFCEVFPHVASEALFILGGEKADFHVHFLDLLCLQYCLSPDQFYFPPGKININNVESLYYFSDQRKHVVHPLNMCHEFFMLNVRALEKCNTKLKHSKIFISRADAGNRRLVNEPAITQMLSKRGFVPIVMSEHGVQEQISMLSNAEEIVAPHGMGLSYLLFNRNPMARVLEIFHPHIGSDAYAFVSKASGLRYSHVIGQAEERGGTDYIIPPGILNNCLDRKF